MSKSNPPKKDASASPSLRVKRFAKSTAGSMPEEGGDSDSDPFLDRYLPGKSAAMARLRKTVLLVNSTRNVDLIRMILVRGETGAGKNHLARVIAGHRKFRVALNTGAWKPGRDGEEAQPLKLDEFTDRFFEINVPSLPEKLVTSELFGYVKGAFSDARTNKPGLLAGDRADDILLDEIGDISHELQTSLLGVLEDGSFRPVGAEIDDVHTVNARLMLATNRPLEDLVRAGSFREDFYHRARLFVVRVPSLRDQAENIPLIARSLEENIQEERAVDLGGSDPRLSDEDMSWAQTYQWPGNVRELKHAIIRWVAQDGRFSLQHCVEDLRAEEAAPASSVSDIASMVTARMAAVLRGEAPPLGQVQSLPQQIEREVKRALNAWFQSTRPSTDDLQKIFPLHKNIESIRNKLGSWGKS